jgi:hypothetical protein
MNKIVIGLILAFNLSNITLTASATDPPLQNRHASHGMPPHIAELPADGSSGFHISPAGEEALKEYFKAHPDLDGILTDIIDLTQRIFSRVIEDNGVEHQPIHPPAYSAFYIEAHKNLRQRVAAARAIILAPSSLLTNRNQALTSEFTIIFDLIDKSHRYCANPETNLLDRNRHIKEVNLRTWKLQESLVEALSTKMVTAPRYDSAA